PTIQSRGVQARAAVALADHVGAGKGDQLAKAELPQRALETIADPEEGHAAHLAREGMVAVPRADVAAVFEGPGFRFEMGGGWGERNPADRGGKDRVVALHPPVLDLQPHRGGNADRVGGQAHAAKPSDEPILEAADQGRKGGDHRSVPSHLTRGAIQYLPAEFFGAGFGEGDGASLESAEARPGQPGGGARGKFVALQVGIARLGPLDRPARHGKEAGCVPSGSQVGQTGRSLPGEKSRGLLLTDAKDRELGEVDGPEDRRDEKGEEERQLHGGAPPLAEAASGPSHLRTSSRPKSVARARARSGDCWPTWRHPSSTGASLARQWGLKKFGGSLQVPGRW